MVRSWAHVGPVLFLATTGFLFPRPEAEPEKLLFSSWLFFKNWLCRVLSIHLPFYIEESRGPGKEITITGC